MKNIIPIAILIALGAFSPSLVSAQSTASQDTSMQTQDPSMQSGGGQSSGSQVQGTAASVDQQSKSLTVTDSASGTDRTFTVSEEDKLKDVKQGDQVTVTPSQNDPSQAQDVQKQQ
jgi:hypothetical protein